MDICASNAIFMNSKVMKIMQEIISKFVTASTPFVNESNNPDFCLEKNTVVKIGNTNMLITLRMTDFSIILLTRSNT